MINYYHVPIIYDKIINVCSVPRKMVDDNDTKTIRQTKYLSIYGNPYKNRIRVQYN
jgi:hypothetical protein